MAEEREEHPGAPEGAGDRRQGERRARERRREERQALRSRWRRPGAYLACGALGIFLVVLAFRGFDRVSAEPIARPGIVVTAPEAAPEQSPVAPQSPRDARSLAQFELLLAEGGSAVGQLVRTELFCGAVTQVTVRSAGEAIPALADLVDAEGRVGGAECRWSDEARTSDFFLVIPPEMAGRFTEMPEIEMNFVLRRRVPAQVEWLGRPAALSLRTAGVLRAIEG